MKSSADILAVLEYMEREKGINRNDMINTIANAIRTAAMKSINDTQDIRVEINPKTGQLHAWMVMEVVDSVSDIQSEIHISKAREIDPTLQVGDIFEKEIDPSYLGRIAAQSARQAIVGGIRHFEKEKIYESYRSRVGDIVTCSVRRHDSGNIYVELDSNEAVMPYKERIPGEEYISGDKIRCLLLKIDQTPHGPELVVSRANSKFVRRLLEIEIAEIADGTVEIMSMAREPGYRTKIAVLSKDPKVDAVGACVGTRGVRVRSIVKELGGEKVDVIRYTDSPEEFLKEAIHPATPRNISVNDDDRQIYFEVSNDDLAIAIGKRGLNAKLTSKLMNWKLDIRKLNDGKSSSISEKISQAAKGLNHVPGIDDEMAKRLVSAGFVSVEVFDDVGVDDLLNSGFSEEEACFVLEKIKQFELSNQ
ncbi:MAG: transcription termination factor NusA [Puniceicoccales bacterium]|jgi:N utilization substance protein A|nr:transcription termination factor NusA [Puniceicoccales bacterium]